ncbi:MAG TPA: hypothetical protein VHP11_06980 [Tepidisphaeraceae bacterium]|nr:hypothetical protein [Tepidisphaeraceae bacterium]
MSTSWGQVVNPLFRTSPANLFLATLAASLLWPPTTLALLMIFQASMHKARIKSSHVLRCVIYSADATFWVAPLLAAGTWGAASYRGPIAMSEWVCWACIAIVPAMHLLMTYRLTMAYRLYLRFQHPTTTVLATQLIVALIVLIILAGIAAGWFR